MEIKSKLESEKNKISKILEQKNKEQDKLSEYNKYDRNTHIGVGIVTLLATTYFTARFLDLQTIPTIIATISTTALTSLTTKIYYKQKKNTLKKQNPNIDFENTNIEENQNEINNLITQKMNLVEKMEKLNTDSNDKIENQIDETITEQPTKEAQKILIRDKRM